MKEESIDNAVYGDLYLDEDESIVIEISVFSRSEEEVITTERVIAESYLDIFSTTDELVTSLLGTFSDRHIAYGGLKLVNRGIDGKYTVVMNGEVIGSSTENLPRLLTGTYSLAVKQKRAAGDTWTFEKEIEVKKETTTTIEFALPSLTMEERERLKELEKEMTRWWGIADVLSRQAIEKAIEFTSAGEEISPRLKQLNRRYENIEQTYLRKVFRDDTTSELPTYEPRILESMTPDRVEEEDEYRFEPASYTATIIADALQEGFPEEKSKSLLRWEAQTAGGTLGVAGINLSGDARRLQFTLMAGAGYTEQVTVAATSRITYAPFSSWFLSPTISFASNIFTGNGSHDGSLSMSIGPSLGFEFRFNEGRFTLYLENYFAQTIMPIQSEYLAYLPALGVKF